MDLDHETGGGVAGWPHVVQSIQTVLSTRIGTRVFRREFGSDVPGLIDAPMNDANVLALYVAIAVALERWEPRFEVTEVSYAAQAAGVMSITLAGTYRPQAHLGDLSTVENQTVSVRILPDRVENWSRE